jgi:hypothetical protein
MKIKYLLSLVPLLIILQLGIKKIIILLMIGGGYFVTPEASSILHHYCFGNGDTLILNSDYLRKSPVIVKNLDKMKVGESRRITLNQEEDWRLSYALNGFTLEKHQTKAVIKQYIKFDKTDETFTYLNLYFTQIKISDNIVHEFDCKDFWVYSEFNY